MNKWKAFSIIFIVLSIGAIKETLRIMTSDAPDIATNRAFLTPMSLSFTLLFIYLAAKFWRKAKMNQL